MKQIYNTKRESFYLYKRFQNKNFRIKVYFRKCILTRNRFCALCTVDNVRTNTAVIIIGLLIRFKLFIPINMAHQKPHKN